MVGQRKVIGDGLVSTSVGMTEDRETKIPVRNYKMGV